MCFYCYKEMRLRTAKKDIICYKTTEAEKAYSEYFISQYYKYKYVLGRKVSKRKPFKFTGHGTHDRFRVINEGFHSFILRLRTDDEVHIKCIIPKGTKYYKSLHDNCYVSLSIKPIEYLDNEKVNLSI